MVFVLPSEFRAPQPEELAIAQLDLGPQPIIFEKPKEKIYKHLKELYLKGLIDGKCNIPPPRGRARLHLAAF